jgi:hypothetical protein
MSKESLNQPGNEAPNVIEDLTPKEAEAVNIKGGPFSWGVEREMKESGERG